jgi:dihydrodipicolinate synthase/N-acetylneuraminate lyase
LNDRELMAFFKDVCGAFADSKFLHYNLPRANRVLTAIDDRQLADAVPNLAATKITGTSVHEACELMRMVPELQHFFGEGLFPIGCLYGQCSLLSSFGPLFPSRTHEFFEYGKRGQFDKLFPMLRQYLDVADEVLSPTRGKTLIDGAYDKMAVRMSGIDFPPRLLSPFEWFSEETYQACRKILHEKYADWMR